MSSRRLPGKVLADVRGQPLLQYLLERVEKCRELDLFVVATSNEASDEPIEALCDEHDVRCFRGPLVNVAERFREAAKRHELDVFVRLCADSPLLDPALIDQAVATFRSAEVDMVSNIVDRTFPPGQSVEVISAPVFAAAVSQMTCADHREHVTSYFYDHAEDFQIRAIRSEQDWGNANFAVDTPADLEQLTCLIAAMERPHWTFGLEELIQLQRGLPNEVTTGSVHRAEPE